MLILQIVLVLSLTSLPIINSYFLDKLFDTWYKFRVIGLILIILVNIAIFQFVILMLCQNN